KPPVVCQLTSPSHYATWSQQQVSVQNQRLPPANMCDYVILDLPQFPDGSYEYGSYEFLSRSRSSGYRLLLTVNMDAANVGNNLVALNSPDFSQSTQRIQHTLGLFGYGTLRGWPVPRTTTELSAAQAVLNVIYERLAQVLNGSGVHESSIANFFGFKPRVTTSQWKDYASFVSMLNGLNKLSLVIMLTISDEHQLEVASSSAWNRICQPVPNAPKMSTAVDLIANVSHPKVNFTLTISLRLDIFRQVSLAALNSRSLRRIVSTGHDAVFFSTQCEQQLFARDPTGLSILDIGNGSCAFAWGPSQVFEVITFETPKTVRSKMVATYRHLGYAKTDTHVIGWTVYNVTLGLAPNVCNGDSSRFNEIRKIVDENK
ncbi:uncharacterized protein LOC125756195, partial [Rhipicephalus sanguineus]|uniref:uncharacterized protein LOC125756195 n=1 Tax=Rhipicephalus sanguineus TaxID=34632 RepID=UPI0020C51F60